MDQEGARREAVDHEDALRVLRHADLLHSPGAVERALDRMAHRIGDELGGEDLLALCVMQGALMTTAGLLLRLDWPVELDYLHVSRYRGKTSGGELVWTHRPVAEIRDRVVLIIDDILDEGHTMAAIMDHCRAQGAARVVSAVLVRKRLQGRRAQVSADYVGLEVEDRYVFGYGMDYGERLRNLPGIYAVSNQ